YITDRVFAPSHDGVEIPISLVRHKNTELTKNTPILLYGYGSYGNTIDPWFSSARLSLLDRGFAFAIAHIRGGQNLGRSWYEDGKLLNKKNSILDYISCAEYLIKEKITTPEHLVGHGNSAGGLVVAAAINERPELFNTVILDHPFVNVLHSMIDPNLPLTIDEYKEWGDPSSEEAYDYIKSYCPYEQLSSKDYPNVIILSGFEDKQTPCWQQAMYMAKLRSSSSENNALMITDLHAGHIGSTVGNNWIKQFSLIYSFVEMMQPD
ncbi:MAG: prolyl oligopeptidase family serine peptidase, partial [Flavobacteriales bacterium]